MALAFTLCKPTQNWIMSSLNSTIITCCGIREDSYEDVTHLGTFRRLLEQVKDLRRILTNNPGFRNAFLYLLEMMYYVEHPRIQFARPESPEPNEVVAFLESHWPEIRLTNYNQRFRATQPRPSDQRPTTHPAKLSTGDILATRGTHHSRAAVIFLQSHTVFTLQFTGQRKLKRPSCQTALSAVEIRHLT